MTPISPACAFMMRFYRSNILATDCQENKFLRCGKILVLKVCPNKIASWRKLISRAQDQNSTRLWQNVLDLKMTNTQDTPICPNLMWVKKMENDWDQKFVQKYCHLKETHFQGSGRGVLLALVESLRSVAFPLWKMTEIPNLHKNYKYLKFAQKSIVIWRKVISRAQEQGFGGKP